MKAFLGVVIIALVAQASAQQLTCFECDDCNNINQQTTPRVQCYQQATVPTRPTNPGAPPVTPTASPNQQENVNLPDADSSNVSGARNNPLFSCFVIRRQVGDRQLTHRGCALTHVDDEQTCIHQNQGVEPYACAICNDDLCNTTDTGTIFLAHILVILGGLFVALRLI